MIFDKKLLETCVKTHYPDVKNLSVSDMKLLDDGVFVDIDLITKIDNRYTFTCRLDDYLAYSIKTSATLVYYYEFTKMSLALMDYQDELYNKLEKSDLKRAER